MPRVDEGAMIIRAEMPSDQDAIDRNLEAAFEGRAEADLVRDLRRDEAGWISLVAVEAGSVAGYIAFTPALLEDHLELRVAALGPMAVAPERQACGIGSDLVTAGLDACRERGYGAAVVLGHPTYYPRFGFVPAAEFSLRSEYAVPTEVFMAQELRPGSLSGRTGLVRYAPAFGRIPQAGDS